MINDERRGYKAYLYLLPALVFMAIFTFYPIIKTFIIAFLDGYHLYHGVGGSLAINFNNFGKVLSDSLFWRAVGNTSVMVFVSVPISVLVALLISVALNSITKLQGTYQTIFFLPYVTNTIALGLVFTFLFTQNGIVNEVIKLFGGQPMAWTKQIVDPDGLNPNVNVTYFRAMFVVLIYSIWNGLAFKILVFLSGLQSIDKQYYQAAQVDATPRWRVFTKITVPLLSPMIAYITITSFIGAFKAYTSVIALFEGRYGPNLQGQNKMLITIVGYTYDLLESPHMYGIAAAASLVLFGIIMLITILQLYVSKKRVHY